MELGEHGHGRDSADVSASVAVRDRLNWDVHWTLEKRDSDVNAYVEERLPFWAKGPVSVLLADRAKAKREELREQFKAEVEPFEVKEWDGNTLHTVGIVELLELLMGAAAQAYDNGNAFLAVGSSPAGINVADTDLTTRTAIVAMNGAYPQIAGTTITFQSDFAGGVGSGAWEECGTFNGNTPPGDEMLNRVVQPLGSKAAGATWTLSMAITIS